MNEDNIKISVIIPTLNVKKYIKQCIESVINQTFSNIEILCVDGGSDDGTLEILKEYSQIHGNLHVFLSNKKSYGSQVNQGIVNAKGDYIAIVESDDYISPEMMETLYDLTELGYVDIVKGTFYHFYESETDKPILKVDNAKGQLKNDKKFIIGEEPLFLEGHPSIWAAIYKKSFLIKNKITFREEPGGAWVDNPFFLETALKANSIRYINKPLYFYREDNENSSSNNLQDLSIPAGRILDMFDILEKEKCDNDEIKNMIYKRLFRYVEITIENNNNSTEGLDYKTSKSLYEALKKVDFEYVQYNVNNKDKKLYYKFRSPLILKGFEED